MVSLNIGIKGIFLVAFSAFRNNDISNDIINFVFKYIHDKDAVIRRAAVQVILAQLKFTPVNRQSVILWSILPLSYDSNSCIRQEFNRLYKKTQSFISYITKQFDSDSQDALEIPIM
jgi:hypothetical protein